MIKLRIKTCIQLFLAILVSNSLLNGQNKYSIDSLSHIPIGELTSSVWGLNHSSGKEIALLGTRNGLRIYDLTDPRNPTEIKFIPGNSCVWRELKTHKDFVYVVTECGDGVLIVDCRDINNIQFHYQIDFVNSNKDTARASSSHTIFIDEKGYLYLSGSSAGQGYACLNLNTDPLNPELVSVYSPEYFHEVFVMRDTIYGASLYNGEFTIMDIRDRKNPVLLARQKTGYNFTHSVWREENRAVIYVADERTGAFLESWDISDVTKIKLLDKYRPNYPIDNLSIPHNCFYKDNYVFVSWYTEGIRILDVSKPDNIVEVAYYDTHPQANVGFHGVWNVYPYFNSGVILASDIENGMFVFSFNKKLAAYLEGKVTDKSTGSPIFDASISIKSELGSTVELSDLLGNYKTGAIENETIEIQVSRPGYFSVQESINLLSATSVITKNFELVPLPQHVVKFHCTSISNGSDEDKVRIKVWNKDFSYEGITDASGRLEIPNIAQGVYMIQSSKWGKRHFSRVNHFIKSSENIAMELSEGYEDQFNFQEAWEMLPADQKLKWKIGNFLELFPKPSNYPSQDISNDVGNQALYTGNFDDFDSNINVFGHSYLKSPEMNFSRYDRINLQYTAWAYGGWETAIKETYLIIGDKIIPVENIIEDLSGNWSPTSEYVFDLSGERSKCYFVMHLWNDPDSAKLGITLKAALDGFKVTGEILNTNKNIAVQEIHVFPIPFHDNLNFYNPTDGPIHIELINLLGKKEATIFINSNSTFTFSAQMLHDNIYYYKALDQNGKIISTNKLLKQSH
ncbi:MAG: choice-of-anchor B family protein [Saprospiraceae bacterium]|nr:choice-of-anchor B family protein [Saprospiraceae bacterium]